MKEEPHAEKTIKRAPQGYRGRRRKEIAELKKQRDDLEDCAAACGRTCGLGAPKKSLPSDKHKN